MPQPEPRGQGNAPHNFLRRIAQIDRHQPESPAWASRSAALSACSTLPPQRTHRTCESRTPAAAALSGSNAFSASINAQNSCPEDAPATRNRAATSAEEAGPAISVSAPRGIPPLEASCLPRTSFPKKRGFQRVPGRFESVAKECCGDLPCSPYLRLYWGRCQCLILLELHARSAFSFLRGACTPEDYADRCAELDQPGMALLDFDGVYGAPRFHLAMKKAGPKAYLGSEITCTDGARYPLADQPAAPGIRICAG